MQLRKAPAHLIQALLALELAYTLVDGLLAPLGVSQSLLLATCSFEGARVALARLIRAVRVVARAGQILAGSAGLLEGRKSHREPSEELLDADTLHLPLVARFVRPGDRMKPLGARGGRKLQDILTDLRVPRWRRGRTLLVTMRDEPVWIVGLRIADAARLTEATKRVLRLRFVRSAPQAQP